ncbi:MAG: hypothetical protein V5A76_07600 [Candidatus Thermoplasmatota archaeon]
MDSGIKLLVTIILPLMLLVAVLYGGGYYMKEFTMTSEYEYEVTIETDGDLQDVNLTVPFPADLSGGSFSHVGGWNIVETGIDEEENNLTISADKISANSTSTLHLSVETDDEISTYDPIEKEPMLDPEANFTEEGCDPSNDTEADKCYSYNYTSTIEVSYRGSPETQIDISVELTGMNEWWLLDNLKNQYSDRLSVQVESEGKYEPEGQVRTGIGD